MQVFDHNPVRRMGVCQIMKIGADVTDSKPGEFPDNKKQNGFFSESISTDEKESG